MKHIYAFVLSIILLVPNPLFAEGSKDLYPSGAMGARAFLVSHNPTAPVTGWPYLTEGTHYVYGRLGETITAASSAQGSGNGQLVLIAPDGMIYSSELGSTVGQIANRSEEVAGPYAVGGYTPFSHMVGPGQEGIWEIRFISTRSTNSFWPKGVSGGANSNWTGHNDNSNAIRAWDVTVFDSAMNPISGRVYANLLNQYTSAGYYGILFVLTNDGYVYKVSANGHSGIGFMSFVNNKGLTLGTGDNAPPSYKSADSFSTDIPTKDPREPDGAKTFTHKMFY